VRGLVESEEVTWDGFTFGAFFREVAPMGGAALPALQALLAERAAAPMPIRTALLAALGETHDPRALPQLVAATRDPMADARATAVAALADIANGGEAALVPLRAALADESAGVREEAARAVGRLRDVAAGPTLRDLLAGDVTAVRQAAARALGRLGDAVAVPALRVALDDKDQDVRLAATEALARLGDADGVTRLQSLLAEDGDDLYDRDATAMRALVELDVTAAFPRIERRLLAFKSGSMPADAIRALARKPAGVALLGRVLAGAGKSALPRLIAEVLEPIDSPGAREALRHWRLNS
jgi:HEAT repeat protein